MEDPLPVPRLHSVLTTTYGSHCRRLLHQLTGLLKKTAVAVPGLVFLLKCRRCSVFPSFISRTVNFARTGPCLARLVHRLPRRILGATIRDQRTRVAALQKELDVVWTTLYRLITDASHWNALVQQKDHFYSFAFTTTTWRLQKKFVVLFHVIPNDSYCDKAADVMLAKARAQSSAGPGREKVSPSDSRLPAATESASFLQEAEITNVSVEKEPVPAPFFGIDTPTPASGNGQGALHWGEPLFQ